MGLDPGLWGPVSLEGAPLISHLIYAGEDTKQYHHHPARRVKPDSRFAGPPKRSGRRDGPRAWADQVGPGLDNFSARVPGPDIRGHLDFLSFCPWIPHLVCSILTRTDRGAVP